MGLEENEQNIEDFTYMYHIPQIPLIFLSLFIVEGIQIQLKTKNFELKMVLSYQPKPKSL